MKYIKQLTLFILASNIYACGQSFTSSQNPNDGLSFGGMLGESGASNNIPVNEGTGGVVPTNITITIINPISSAGQTSTNNGGSSGNVFGVNNAGEAGNIGGSAGVDGSVNNVASCLDLFNQGSLVNNTYNISGNDIYCDMNHGGWALIYSTTYGNPCAIESTKVTPNTASYLSGALVKSIANQSSQIHIQTAGQWDTESITSTKDSQPIKDLSQLIDLSAGSNNTVWTGPYNDNRVIGSYQGDKWPNIYHAAGNVEGIHIGPSLSNEATCFSRWRFNDLDVAIEVYVK